jgi:hypothetical protein
MMVSAETIRTGQQLLDALEGARALQRHLVVHGSHKLALYAAVGSEGMECEVMIAKITP